MVGVPGGIVDAAESVLAESVLAEPVLAEPGAVLAESGQVAEAARWLAGRVVQTPVLRCPALDELAGARLWLKAENLQETGSYKVRGATLAVGRVAARGGRGVIAQSTGNHGLAVAHAAAAQGLAATIVLPRDAVAHKVDRIRATGSEVVLAGGTLDERLAVVERLSRHTGYEVVDAYDHPDVIAGQGTATLELVRSAQRCGTALDAVVVPVGGGGGLAGAALATRGSGIALIGVEPVGCDSLARSLRAGAPVTVEPGPSLADGLRPSRVGRLPFELLKSRGVWAVQVDEPAIARATCLALLEARLVVEPSAGAALAGALQIAATGRFQDVGVLLTGGNTEIGLLSRLLGECREPAATAVPS
jgi:threonine dehydratase